MSSAQQPGVPVESSTAPGKGTAIAAMVLGIAAVVSVLLDPALVLVSIVTAVVGLVLGLVALRGTRRTPATHGGRGQAVAGVVLSAVTLLGTLVVLVYFGWL